MKRVYTIGNTILGVLILVVSVYGVFWLFGLFKGWFDSLKLNPTVTQALVVGVFTFAGVLVGKFLERRKDVEFQLRERKIPIYEDFIKMWFDILAISHERRNAVETGKEESGITPKLQDDMVDMAGKLILWGSNGVIQKYSALRQMTGMSEQDAFNKVLDFEEVLKEVRKDLGHSTFGLKRGQLLGLFLNDVNAILKRPPKVPAKVPARKS